MNLSFSLRCYSMGLTLHQHSHSHGGLGSHSHETSGPSSTTNINVRAAYVHVLGDIIQSLGVLIAAVILYYKVSNFRENTCHPARILFHICQVWRKFLVNIWFVYFFILLSKSSAYYTMRFLKVFKCFIRAYNSEFLLCSFYIADHTQYNMFSKLFTIMLLKYFDTHIILAHMKKAHLRFYSC